MLIDFTVENYRSIKEAITLSMIATQPRKSAKPTGSRTARKIKPDAEITPGFHIEAWNFSLLPVCAIYGANASGKTNLLNAVHELQMYLAYGSNYFELLKSSGFVPFRLDENKGKATAFAARFIAGGNLYRYKLAIEETPAFRCALFIPMAPIR